MAVPCCPDKMRSISFTFLALPTVITALDLFLGHGIKYGSDKDSKSTIYANLRD